MFYHNVHFRKHSAQIPWKINIKETWTANLQLLMATDKWGRSLGIWVNRNILCCFSLGTVATDHFLSAPFTGNLESVLWLPWKLLLCHFLCKSSSQKWKQNEVGSLWFGKILFWINVHQFLRFIFFWTKEGFFPSLTWARTQVVKPSIGDFSIQIRNNVVNQSCSLFWISSFLL